MKQKKIKTAECVYCLVLILSFLTAILCKEKLSCALIKKSMKAKEANCGEASVHFVLSSNSVRFGNHPWA